MPISHAPARHCTDIRTRPNKPINFSCDNPGHLLIEAETPLSGLRNLYPFLPCQWWRMGDWRDESFDFFVFVHPKMDDHARAILGSLFPPLASLTPP